MRFIKDRESSDSHASSQEQRNPHFLQEIQGLIHHNHYKQYYKDIIRI